MKKLLTFSVLFLLSGCLGMPNGVSPISDFKLESYLGRWYEVARLDHSFEAGLSSVTADYKLRDDGGISVINRGFSQSKNEWKEAEGKAYFVNEADEGYLKVSFSAHFTVHMLFLS